jgi:hypothetical protein
MKGIVILKRVIASHGLGNQLFQFCFAHNLTESEQRVRFENNPIWSPGLEYSLNELKYICPHLYFRTNPSISHTSVLGRLVYRLKIAIPIANVLLKSNDYSHFIEDPKDNFTYGLVPNFSDDSRVSYTGFWMHWAYPHSQINSAIVDIQRYLEEKVKLVDCFSREHKNMVVHIRRGDFLERGNDSTFGIISPQSYKGIIKLIKTQIPNINIVTLTDDFNLANNILYGDDFGQILPPNHCDPWQALKLMSQADVVISANSTLSWWGAVLASLNGGTSYIPKKFYKNIDTKDAYNFPGLYVYDNTHL